MENYLIWSNEHNAWWGPGRKSYTVYIEKAGRYPLEEAVEICNGANSNWNKDYDKKMKLPDELPISEKAAMLLKGPRD